MTRLFAAGSILALAACGGVAEQGTPATGKRDRLINIELVGAPECLGATLAELDLGLAVLPEWKQGIGVVEAGPVEQERYVELARTLREKTCVRSFRPRPCHVTGTDIAVCTPGDEVELGNGVAELHPPI